MSLSALYHVGLVHPPLAVDVADGQSVHYDDGNRLLLVAGGGRVLSYAVDARAPTSNACVAVGEGPVLAARFSLDVKVLALQRSPTDVEFVGAEGGAPFWQRCKRPSEHILGFFWASSAGVDFVLATTGGLELYALQPARNGLRLVEEKRKPGITWMLYTHETRLALLGCGAQGNKLFGFQCSGAGRVKLPKFELPTAGAVTGDDVRLLAVYGRLFCAHIDAEACTLVLYRFYRDALLRQHSFPLPSAAVAVSVVDNALVLCTLDSGVALVLDVLSASMHPLASPLPLGYMEAASPLPGGAQEQFPGVSELHFLSPDLALHRCGRSAAAPAAAASHAQHAGHLANCGA